MFDHFNAGSAPVSRARVARPKSQKSTLTETFSCVCCACGSTALAHIGCIVTPVMMTAAIGTTFIPPSMVLNDNFMPSVSAAFGVVGLGAWYGLRGRKAKMKERMITIAGAIAGTFMVATGQSLLVLSPSSEQHQHSTQLSQLSPLEKRVVVDLMRANVPMPLAIEQAHNICGSSSKPKVN